MFLLLHVIIPQKSTRSRALWKIVQNLHWNRYNWITTHGNSKIYTWEPLNYGASDCAYSPKLLPITVTIQKPCSSSMYRIIQKNSYKTEAYCSILGKNLSGSHVHSPLSEQLWWQSAGYCLSCPCVPLELFWDRFGWMHGTNFFLFFFFFFFKPEFQLRNRCKLTKIETARHV